MSRKSIQIILNDYDANLLQNIIQGQPESSLSRRASIILECAKGRSNKDIAEEFSMTENDVGKWRKRFIAEGINGLQSKHGGGPKASMSSEELDLKLDELLADSTREWTTKELMEATGATYYSISMALQRKDRPTMQRRTEWFIPTKDELVSKHVDVIGLYLSHHDQVIVLCHSPTTLSESTGILYTRNRSLADELQRVKDLPISLAETIMTAYWHVNDTSERKTMSISDFLENVINSNPQDENCEYHAFVCSQISPKQVYRGKHLDRLHITLTKNVQRWLDATQFAVENMGDSKVRDAASNLKNAIQSFLDHSIDTTIPLSWIKKVSLSKDDHETRDIGAKEPGQSGTSTSLQSALASVLKEYMPEQQLADDIVKYGFISYAMDRDGISINMTHPETASPGFISCKTFDFSTRDGVTAGVTCLESEMIETRNQAGIQGMELVLDMVKKKNMRSV